MIYCMMFCLSVFLWIVPTAFAVETLCDRLIPQMAEAMQALRTGTPLTPDQQQTWRQWNSRCTDPARQHQLAQAVPPLTVSHPTPIPRQDTPPPLVPKLTWRDYALAAVQGFERGATAPITSCRTTYARRGSRAGYYTTCLTH